MQALFSVNKSSFKINDPWVLDFTINDENAYATFEKTEIYTVEKSEDLKVFFVNHMEC